MNKLSSEQKNLFDDIKHFDEYGNEFWFARELQTVLGYAKWENFHKVIKTAMIACKISQQSAEEQFHEVRKSTISGKGKQSSIIDYKLTRYACYLIVMNCDSRKKPIALSKTYFAVKTRQQELAEGYDTLPEDEKRQLFRGNNCQKNMLLAGAAHKARITTQKEYAIFQDSGYMGLYNGMTARDIAEHKGLHNGEEILDYMGGEEFAANLFCITQTEEKIRRENIDTPEKANAAHYKVGKIVRKTIATLGGTMPEDLPTPENSMGELESQQRNQLKPKKNKCYSTSVTFGELSTSLKSLIKPLKISPACPARKKSVSKKYKPNFPCPLSFPEKIERLQSEVDRLFKTIRSELQKADGFPS